MQLKKVQLFILFISLYSCISYKYIDIEFYDLPEKRFNLVDNKLLILENLYLRNTDTPVLKLDWALDSTASGEACESLVNLLATSPWFSEVNLSRHIVYRSDSSRVILPLAWQTLDSLSDLYSCKTIISLDYVKVRPYYDIYPVWRSEFKEYYGFIRVSSYSYWRVYNVSSRKIELGKLITDTLLWEKNDWAEITLGNQLPGMFEACAYAGADAGERFSHLIAPQWQKDSRVIYVPSHHGEMNRAYRFALQGNWLDAAAIWQPLTLSSNKRLAAQAAFNMALANEMMNKFDVALEWINVAKPKNPNLKFLQEYRDILQERKRKNLNNPSH